MKTFGVALALAACVGAAHAAVPAAGEPTLDSVTFESRPDLVTVRIATSVPVPRFDSGFGQGGDPALIFADVSSRLDGQYEFPGTPLGPLRVDAPAAGSRGKAVLRFSLRDTSLVGIEQRADG